MADLRKWKIEAGYDWDWDRAEGVVLVCTSCASVGTFRIDGDTLAHVLQLAADHDHVIHRR